MKYIKNVVKSILAFLVRSNHYKHIYCGLIIFTIGLFMPLWLLPAYVVTIAAATAEYKDKAHCGVWDWVDFACTIVVPYVITIISRILYVI